MVLLSLQSINMNIVIPANLATNAIASVLSTFLLFSFLGYILNSYKNILTWD